MRPTRPELYHRCQTSLETRRPHPPTQRRFPRSVIRAGDAHPHQTPTRSPRRGWPLLRSPRMRVTRCVALYCQRSVFAFADG